MRSPLRRAVPAAFTLVELLAVLAIILVILGLIGPSVVGLVGAGGVDREVSDFSGVLASARAYAMANHTYVRVAMGVVPNSTPAAVAVLPIYSASGELDADTPANMADLSKWPALRPPLILSNAVFNDALNGKAPNTTSDVRPSQSDIGSLANRTSPPSIASVTFTAYVQFGPSGEARVLKEQLPRFIASGVDEPIPQQGRNPFILRLSGVNGTITTLRKENM